MLNLFYAVAYLEARQGVETIGEFRKILDHPGIVPNSIQGALAHLGLARGYVLAGGSTKAKAVYEEFLILWQGADSDIPVLKVAAAEYPQLQ